MQKFKLLVTTTFRKVIEYEGNDLAEAIDRANGDPDVFNGATDTLDFDTNIEAYHETVVEWCPFCEQEVRIEAIPHVKQHCPNCGKPIRACSLCDCDNCDCDDCERKNRRYYNNVGQSK